MPHAGHKWDESTCIYHIVSHGAQDSHVLSSSIMPHAGHKWDTSLQETEKTRWSHMQTTGAQRKGTVT